MTVKPCNRLAVGANRLGRMAFIDVFFYLFQHLLCLVCFPQVVQEQMLGEVRTETLI